MIANFYEKGGSKKAIVEGDKKEALPEEKVSLLSDTDISDNDGFKMSNVIEMGIPERTNKVADLLDFENEFEVEFALMEGAKTRGPVEDQALGDIRLLGKELQESVKSRFPDTFKEIETRIKEKIQSPAEKVAPSRGTDNFV